MEPSDWIPILQIAVAILLPGVGFLAAQTISNAKAVAKLEGKFELLDGALQDIKNRLASIEDAIRKKL